MRLQKQKNLMIFFLLILLNLVIRIPSIPHESGFDSFYNHLLTASVSEFGFAKWWVNILSVAGFYPYSECSAVPFFLSGISQCTHIDIEYTILLTSIILGILSMFTMYLLAGEISNDETFKIFSAFSYSLSPGILSFTTWNISTRGMYLVLLPLFTYLLFRTKRSAFNNSLLAILLLFLLATTHHFIFFTIPLIISYFITIIIFPKIRNYSNLLNVAFIALLIIAFLIPFLTGLFIDQSKYLQLREMIDTNIRYTGILIIFAFSGLVYLSLKKSKSFGELFLLISALFFAPLMWIPIYAYWFALLYACLFIGFSLSNLTKNYTLNKKHVALILIISLCLSTSMSGFYQHWRTKSDAGDWYLDEKTYTAALWTKDYIGLDQRLVGTDDMVDLRMFAISGVPTLLDAADVQMFIYGFANLKDTPIIKNSFTSLSFYYGDPYEIDPNYSRVGYVKNRLKTLDAYSSDGRNLISGLNLSYVVDNELLKPCELVDSMHTKSDNIFDNGKISIWKL